MREASDFVTTARLGSCLMALRHIVLMSFPDGRDAGLRRADVDWRRETWSQAVPDIARRVLGRAT